MPRVDNLHTSVDGSPIVERLRIGTASIIALLVAGCATAADPTVPGDASAWRTESVDAQGGPARGYSFPAQVYADLYENFTGGEEGAPGLSIELSELDDDVVAISTQTGLLDDSVEAVQQRVVLERRADGLWWARERGVRFRCYRGARPGRWTTGLCP